MNRYHNSNQCSERELKVRIRTFITELDVLKRRLVVYESFKLVTYQFSKLRITSENDKQDVVCV